MAKTRLDYDLSTRFSDCEHIVEVTFADGDYRKKVTHECVGNVYGFKAIETVTADLCEMLAINVQDGAVFEMKDSKKEILEIDANSDENLEALFQSMVVKVEVIQQKRPKKLYMSKVTK